MDNQADIINVMLACLAELHMLVLILQREDRPEDDRQRNCA